MTSKEHIYIIEYLDRANWYRC